MTDRAVQDDVIRYLANAKLRASAASPISAGETGRATRFAHFLARRYYRDRLARSFRYSHRFRAQTGRVAEQVVDRPEFDAFLSSCVLGSLQAAQRVGQFAAVHLEGTHPAPWWPDLLEYEYVYFLQAATSEPTPPAKYPRKGLSAVCRRFAWALPQMLPQLRLGHTLEEDLRRPATLLFSRTHTGRIYVVEIEEALEHIFAATNAQQTPEQIAQSAGVSLAAARQALDQLAQLGAIRTSGPAMAV